MKSDIKLYDIHCARALQDAPPGRVGRYGIDIIYIYIYMYICIVRMPD